MGTICKMKIIGRNGEYELSVQVDDEDYRTLGLADYKWHRLIGRSTTYICSQKKRKTIYLHRLIMGCIHAPRSVFVDHIDGNGLNNSRTNLRVTDNRGNQGNARKGLSAGFTSTYKGVCYNSYNKTNPWKAQITLPEPQPNPSPDKKRRGKRKYLGCYRTQEEAARAYNEAAIELFGPHAHLNNIGLSPAP